MAVEKAAMNHAVPMDDARQALEKALTDLQEAFHRCPKSTLKRRLKKLGKIKFWPDPPPAQ